MPEPAGTVKEHFVYSVECVRGLGFIECCGMKGKT